jgi:hypothetical protein
MASISLSILWSFIIGSSIKFKKSGRGRLIVAGLQSTGRAALVSLELPFSPMCSALAITEKSRYQLSLTAPSFPKNKLVVSGKEDQRRNHNSPRYGRRRPPFPLLSLVQMPNQLSDPLQNCHPKHAKLQFELIHNVDSVCQQLLNLRAYQTLAMVDLRVELILTQGTFDCIYQASIHQISCFSS